MFPKTQKAFVAVRRHLGRRFALRSRFCALVNFARATLDLVHLGSLSELES